MTIREKVARAISESAGIHYTDLLDVADDSINAFLEAAAEKGWHIRPDEATAEMLRAWVATQIDGKSGKDPDEMVPIPGTGQGDLQFHEFWRDVVENISLETRVKNMLAAAPEFELDK